MELPADLPGCRLTVGVGERLKKFIADLPGCVALPDLHRGDLLDTRQCLGGTPHEDTAPTAVPSLIKWRPLSPKGPASCPATPKASKASFTIGKRRRKCL
jgi:hypothetical protein